MPVRCGRRIHDGFGEEGGTHATSSCGGDAGHIDATIMNVYPGSEDDEGGEYHHGDWDVEEEVHYGADGRISGG